MGSLEQSSNAATQAERVAGDIDGGWRAVKRQIAQARSRLTSQLFFSYLSVSLLIGLSLAVVAIAVPKLWYVSIETTIWTAGCLAIGAIAALLFTSIMTIMHRPSLMVAAIEVDRRFALRERLSSTMQLSSYDFETPVGQALLRDAMQKAERLDVRDHFRVGMSRRMLWSFIPLALGVSGLFIPDAVLPTPVAAKENKVGVTQISNSVKPVIEQIRKKREDAEEKGLDEVADMFKKIESELEKLQKDPTIDQKSALAKLNEIKKQMEQRRDELGGGQNLQKNLQNLKDIDKGPAEKLAKALQEGDLEKASDELQKMMDALKDEQLSPEQEKALQKQMEELEKAFNEMIEEHEQAKQQLKQQLAQAEQSGNSQKAADLRKQLDELESMDSQMKQMADMASTMQNLQQALSSGDKKAAQQAMKDMQAKMQNMKMNMDQLRELQEMMDQLSDSKNQMACENCNGQGCAECMGDGKGQSSNGRKGNGFGKGLGQGRGFGDRPEEESNTSLVDSQVRDQMRAGGEMIRGGKASGANKKGVTREEVKEAILNSEPENAEALESLSLPKAQRDQTRDYFNALRDGK